MPLDPASAYELLTHSGIHVPQPSRDDLAEHIAALATPDNADLYVQPHTDADWYVLVSLPDPATCDPYAGTYEIHYQDGRDQWTELGNHPSEIAATVLTWVIARAQHP